MDFSPDGTKVLTTHANGNVRIWATDSGKLIGDVEISSAEVRVAAFVPNAPQVLIGDTDGRLVVWGLPESRVLRTIDNPVSEKNAISGISFSPDGGTLVTEHVSKSGPSIAIWNTARWTAQVRKGFSSSAFSPDGKWIALGGSHIELANMKVFGPVRTVTLRRLTLAELFADTGLPDDMKHRATETVRVEINSLAFSPNGAELAAACEDGTIRIIKVPN